MGGWEEQKGTSDQDFSSLLFPLISRASGMCDMSKQYLRSRYSSNLYPRAL